MTEEKLSPKVMALYEAVHRLLEEGADINTIKVADLTARAGIGKGTAYDYFENKEEIIGSAILYHISSVCREFGKKIKELDSFSGTIDYALNYMETEIGESDCFIKFIHVFSGNGAVSRTLQRMIEQERGSGWLPEDLIAELLEIGIKNGEIRETAPKTYMVMTLASKLLVYAVYLTGGRKPEECSCKEMHQLIYDSLLKEFGGNNPEQ